MLKRASARFRRPADLSHAPRQTDGARVSEVVPPGSPGAHRVVDAWDLRSEAVSSTSGTGPGASALMFDVVFQRYPAHECLGRRVLVEIMFSWRDSLTRSRQSSARLCVGLWVMDYTSAKRHVHYITSAAVRAAGGSVGMGPAWDAIPRGGGRVNPFPNLPPVCLG